MPNFVSLTAVNTETRLSFEKSSSNFEKKKKKEKLRQVFVYF